MNAYRGKICKKLNELSGSYITRPLVSFMLPFTIYLLTLAPSVYNLDSAELTTAAATLGITRATGYPLYTLLGHVWSLALLGDVGYRMNLFSALFGALTIMLADRILVKWRVPPVAAFSGLGLLAVAPYFWGLSLIAEVYTLHTAFMAGILLALQRWDEVPTPRRLMCLSAVTGLSLTHHAASYLLLPGIMLFLGLSHRDQLFKPHYFLPALGTGLLALSVLLYLPLRISMNPAFNYAGYYDAQAVFHVFDLQNLREFFLFISGQGFSGMMFAYSIPELITQTAFFGQELLRAFFIIGSGPGLAGMVMLLARNRKMGLLLTLWFVFTAFFYINYKVIDKATMFLPCYLVWGIAVSVCYDQFLRWLGSNLPKLQNRPLAILQWMIVLPVIAAAGWNWSLVNQADQWSVRLAAEQRLNSLPQNAVVIGYWDTIPAMEYLQKVEGFRSDVLLINRFLIPNDVFSILIENVATQKPLYLSFHPGDLPPGMSAIKDGQLVQLSNNNLFRIHR